MCVCVCVCVAKPVAVELRCHATALINNTQYYTIDFFSCGSVLPLSFVTQRGASK